MREIKFRAWDTETKEMSYDFLNKNWLKVCIGSPYIELMQYSGLHDRNGKEIYEGDIIKIPDLYETPENTATTYHTELITFEEGCFQSGGYPLRDDWDYLEDEAEVIGNRFEHPHLLGEKGEGQ